jgi:hypothetical protein
LTCDTLKQGEAQGYNKHLLSFTFGVLLRR